MAGVLGLLVLGATSCSDGAGLDGDADAFAVAPTSMVIDPNRIVMPLGQTIAMIARDQNGATLPVQWGTTNASVASVSSTGIVTARRVGRVLISARWGNQTRYSATASIDVRTSVVAMSIVLTPDSVTIGQGATSQLTAQALDSSNARVLVPITWSSSNPAVATVSSTGVVSGVAPGGATITASAGQHSAATSVTVNPATELPPPPPPPPAPPVPVTPTAPVVASVVIAPSAVTLEQGGTSLLSAQALDSTGAAMSAVSFTWSSSNPQVATVTGSGSVAAVAAGTATVTATAANGRSGSATVTVNTPLPPPPPPPPAPPSAPGERRFLFTSDWSTPGTTTSAKTDASRWNVISDPGNGLSVIGCQSLGFPSETCLQVLGVQAASGFARLAKTGMPVPAAGESMYFRWYYRHEQRSLGDNSQHPIESGQTGGLDWSFNTETMTDNTWRPEFRPGGEQSNALLARFTGPVLQRGVTYRIEMQIQKISSTQFYMHARIYDTAGNLIAGDANFTNDRLGNTGANARSLANNPVLRFQTAEGSQLNEIRAGVNGIAGSDWFPQHLYAYQGGLAVCAGDWCGAYAAGEGR